MQKAVHGITVAHFVETHREKLRMEIVAGEDGLHRLIQDQRKKLALAFARRAGMRRGRVVGPRR